MLRDAALLAGKDLRLYLRDRVGLLLGFALPIALVAVFGFIMGRVGGGGGDLPAVPIAVLDEDGTARSAAFVAALRADGLVDPRLPAADETWTDEVLRAELREGDFGFALVLPVGFAAGRDPVLLRDPGRSLEGRLVQMALAVGLARVRGPALGWEMTERGLLAAGLPEAFRERIRHQVDGFRTGVEGLFRDSEAADAAGATAGAAPPAAAGPEPDPLAFLERLVPLVTEDVAPEGREAQLSYQVSHAVSGMTVMMLLFTLVGFSRTLLTERDGGTLRRLVAAPIDPRAILLGKALATATVGLALVVVLFGFAAAVFDVDVLSRFDTLAVLALATVAASTAFALLIATWAATDKQADGLSTLLILVMSALGGAWFPTMFMPPLAQRIARFTLPYWSLEGFHASLWYGQHWTEPGVLASLGVLLGVTVVLGAAAVGVFRRRYLAG